MRIITLLAATLVIPSVGALPPRPAPAQTEPTALVGATIHVGNGEVIENGVITFADGKITAVGTTDNVDTRNHQMAVISGSHVYPGLILPDSDLGLQEVSSINDTVDNEEQGELNPNVRTLIAYNTDSEMTPTLRFNGVLIAQVSPSGGLVSGTSSIVQLDAWNWEDAAVVEDDGVFVSWPSRKVGQFDWSTFSFNFVDNKNYDNQRQSVEKLFLDAAKYDGKPVNLKLAALNGLFDGSRTLFLRNDVAKDIVESVQFMIGAGVQNVVVIGQNGLLDAAPFLREKNIPVIVGGVHRTPAVDHADVDLPYRLPAMLVEEGLTVGLTYPSLMNARNLPFIAGTAAAYGLDPERALQMITLSNAEILGIDDRLGSLEAGKDATFFVSTGDALDMRTNNVTHAFINGRETTIEGTQQELFQRFSDKYSAP